MDEVSQIRERINLVDFISESVKLKKMGRNFTGLCPFHNERTPSFVVSPERNIWHCFGCGKGGDVYTFLMEMDKLEFPEALKLLAQKTGIELKQQFSGSPQNKLREQLFSIHHLLSEYYQYVLTTHSLGERGRYYLKNRGITNALIKTFALGFAPNAWDNATAFLKKKGFTDKELELSGVCVRGRSGLYDRFRNRIMFPLFNYRGQAIAFAGRLLEADVREAKYINSPETPLYIKGETLYGLNVTKEAIRTQKTAVVVEGEFDVISSFHAGVTNVVAIKGTALTEMQVGLLKRFSEKIILALDQDSAGDAAARRGIEIADRAGLDIRVVKVPNGKDPDEAARHNSALWQAAIDHAVPFYDFVIESAVLRFGTTEAFAKKKISDEVLPVVAKIENTIVKAHYVKKLSDVLEIPAERIHDALRFVKLPKATQPAAAPVLPPKSQEVRLEEHLLALFVQAQEPKDILHKITDAIDPSDCQSPTIGKLFMELIDHLALHPTFNHEVLLVAIPAELKPTLDQAYLTNLSDIDEIKYTKEVEQTLNRLKHEQLRRKMKVLTTNITTAEAVKDEALLKQLTDELQILTEALKLVS